MKQPAARRTPQTARHKAPEIEWFDQDEEPLFARMGKVYKLLVDEKKRKDKEQKFLIETAEAARSDSGPRKRPARETHVLDLACGTGFHSRLLAKAGFPVTAIDASEPILVEAKRMTLAERATRERRIKYLLGDLLEPLRIEHPAALTLILGNTLSLFIDRGDLRKVLRHAARATAPRGFVLTQTLNFERFKTTECFNTTRHGKIDGRETVLTKTLQRIDDGRILLTLCAAQPGPFGMWDTASDSTILTPLHPEEIAGAARRAGLRLESRFGNMSREPFDPQSSTDCVLLFRKK